jgi:hypothetical protein
MNSENLRSQFPYNTMKYPKNDYASVQKKRKPPLANSHPMSPNHHMSRLIPYRYFQNFSWFCIIFQKFILLKNNKLEIIKNKIYK